MIVEETPPGDPAPLNSSQQLIPLAMTPSEKASDHIGSMKTFTPRSSKPTPLLKTLKEFPNFRHSSFFETSTLTKKQDEQGQKRLNQYILYQVIGQGAFGKVRKAYWPERDRYYAVKIINKKHVRKLSRATRRPGGDGLDSVRKEFAIWKLLDHPNIVQLKEVIDAPQSEKMYMVSELIDGGAIVDGDTTCTPLIESQAKHFFCQLIEGIGFLHFHKVIHRDIKPSNILCGADGILKITDFGLSHVFEDPNEDFRQTVGTGPFLAPEMLTGGKFKGIPVDIWACGVTLYMILFGYLPFQGNTLPELYENIKNKTVEYPIEINNEPVNPDLIDLLNLILEKNPDTRITIDEIRAHPWTQKAFERVKSVKILQHISITADCMNAAISTVHLYEKLHHKIKALAVVTKLGQCLHAHSVRHWKDDTLPNIVNSERIESVEDAKAHLLQEAPPNVPKRPSFLQSPRFSTHKSPCKAFDEEILPNSIHSSSSTSKIIPVRRDIMLSASNIEN